MASALDFAIVLSISGLDRVTGAMRQIGQSLDRVAEQARSLSERMTEAGEKMAVIVGIAKEGAEKLMGFIESPLEAATNLQATMARMQSATGLAGDQMEALERHADRFSMSLKGYGVSTTQYLGAFQNACNTLHNFAQAQQTANQAVELGTVTGTDAKSAMDTLLAMHENFGLSAACTNAILGATIQQFSLGPDKLQAFNYAMGRAAGSLHLVNGNVSELAAVMGEAGTMLPGGRGAQLFASPLAEMPEIGMKAGLDTSHGLLSVLAQMRARLAGVAPQMQTGILKSMGVQGAHATMLVTLLGQLDKIRAAQAAIGNANYGDFTAQLSQQANTAAAAEERFAHGREVLAETLGKTLLPRVTAWLDDLTRTVKAVSDWSARHRELAGWILKGALANVFSAALSWVKSFLADWGKVILFGLTGPFGMIAYEIYKHWPAIKSATEKIAGGIMDFFPHSPAKVGPLRYIDRVNIVGAIAETMRPAPMVRAATRVAALTAIAMPAAISAASPAYAAPNAMSGSARASIVINAPITIHANGADAKDFQDIVADAFERHRRELVNAMHRELAVRARTEF